MTENDTVKLLRECDAGVKMAVSSIDEVLDSVRSPALKNSLTDSMAEHKKLGGEIKTLLSALRDEGKDPNPVAKTMSWVKTNVKLASDGSDETVADLMTDGCDMGVKSLGRYLNKYKAADEASKAVAGRLIAAEKKLADDVRPFL